MFNYTEKTLINKSFKINELFKLIKADKTMKANTTNITAIKLSHILSPATTNLEPSKNTKEIYIFEIEINKAIVPEKFIEALNKNINLQTLFKIKFANETKYISSLKVSNEADEVKILKMYSTNWQEELHQDFPITTKLETLFKTIITNITKLKFRLDETFEQYTQRQTTINKKKQEIEKLTRMMNNQKQPNIRMAMNDKIKQLIKEAQTMEKVDV